MVGDPLVVRHPGGTAGDDAEVPGPEPHDRQVRAKAARVIQERGVHHPADRHLHLGHRELLHGVQRAWPIYLEDRERGQVEQRGPLTHGQVLGVDDR